MEFTPIAMRCTQEQFDAVKPKLEVFRLSCIWSFEDFPYLTNNLGGETNTISNLMVFDKDKRGRTVHETWNEEIFLKACGIEFETLQEKALRLETELKEVKQQIEEENKPKVGDICLMDNGLYEFIALFKERNDKDIERLNIRKLTKQQLIEWYDSRSTKN